MHSVVEINDPKRRNEIVNNFLKNRKEHKIKNLQERSDLEHVEDYRIEVFKPILESNKKLQEEIIDEKNKIVETLNNFKSPSQLSIGPPSTSTPKTNRKSLIKQPSVVLPPSLPSSSPPQVVSNLIVSYLQDNSDRSNAGYSIKFNKAEKKYAIGNKDITFDQNIIKVNNEEYTATEGLMELLLKKSPDLNKITTKDSSNYQKILLCSNALYQGFDKESKRYNSDSSDKWKFIKSKYFVAKTPTTAGTSSTSGSSISFIPSNTNSLIDLLRLSIGSYQAGNKDEYNKIHAMLDELVKQKVIKKKDLGVIYLNIARMYISDQDKTPLRINKRKWVKQYNLTTQTLYDGLWALAKEMDVSRYIDRKPRNAVVDNVHLERTPELQLYKSSSAISSMSELYERSRQSKETVETFEKDERENCSKITF
ncbi:Protein CBG22567 [Caenorhabditis briggsae]|uniref:Protein CBG22567 n=1 Tax=Caenorhabditis briggsae TaxID=6238 RepID=A8Y2K4_CAEBR|nr:Protein CBG22567 [Caenorhabditis briggsae]CAP39128.1 Protein CBG22567 [Caenorhabditis briggsae]